MSKDKSQKQKHNINHPSTIYIPNISILKQLNFNNLIFPVIVKRVSQSGAVGCTKVNNKTELFTIANMIFYTGQGIILQEFISEELKKPSNIESEKMYYKSIFEKYYPDLSYILPYFWMPRYTNATDPSARTLSIYKK